MKREYMFRWKSLSLCRILTSTSFFFLFFISRFFPSFLGVKEVTRLVFVKHGCPQWQQNQNMAKSPKSYILTPSHLSSLFIAFPSYRHHGDRQKKPVLEIHVMITKTWIRTWDLMWHNCYASTYIILSMRSWKYLHKDARMVPIFSTKLSYFDQNIH